MPNLLADGTFSTVDEEYDYEQLLKFEDDVRLQLLVTLVEPSGCYG